MLNAEDERHRKGCLIQSSKIEQGRRYFGELECSQEVFVQSVIVKKISHINSICSFNKEVFNAYKTFPSFSSPLVFLTKF